MNAAERTEALVERRSETEGRTARIWTTSEFVDFPVYSVPTDLLVLNPENRRFRAEAQVVLKEFETLGPDLKIEDDESSIIALLLDKDPHVEGDAVVGSASKDTKALVEDWNRRKQEQPLWVRPDGSVSNGNRRLAMLKRLQAEHGADGYDRVDVVFMDETDYDEETIFEMEAREQLTEGLKLRYTEMNSLLTLRDAAEKRGVNWNDPKSIADVAKLIRHLAQNSANYAKVQLLAVKYLTDYLEWRGTPGDFGSLRRMVERFRDLGRNMEWVTKNDSERETAMMLLCFLAIDAGAKHGELRAIRTLAQTDPEEFDRLANEVEALWVEPDEEEEGVIEEPPPAERTGEDDDDDENEEDEYPRPHTAKQARIRQAVRGAAEALRAGAEPPAARVRAAASGLADVDPAAVLASTTGVTHDQVRQAIGEVIDWAEVAEGALEGQDGGD